MHGFIPYVRMIYAYCTPEIVRHDGWLKIGEMEQGVDKRIKQQTHAADVRFELEWKDIAMSQQQLPSIDVLSPYLCQVHNVGTIIC